MPSSQSINDDPGVTKEEFKQPVSAHFKRMNVDTTSVINDALKPIEAPFDEAGRMLDKHLATQL